LLGSSFHLPYPPIKYVRAPTPNKFPSDFGEVAWNGPPPPSTGFTPTSVFASALSFIRFLFGAVIPRFFLFFDLCLCRPLSLKACSAAPLSIQNMNYSPAFRFSLFLWLLVKSDGDCGGFLFFFFLFFFCFFCGFILNSRPFCRKASLPLTTQELVFCQVLPFSLIQFLPPPPQWAAPSLNPLPRAFKVEGNAMLLKRIGNYSQPILLLPTPQT